MTPSFMEYCVVIMYKRVFVSGGAGVIGRQLCRLLLEEGVELLVGDLKPCPSEWAGRLQYRQGDLNELTQVELDSFAPELFIHLAATFERSVESWEFWQENFRHNVALSHHLMSMMRETPEVKRVIFASSYLIYEPDLYLFDVPCNRAVKLDESAPIRPRNLIGMAKLAHEMELRFLADFPQTRFDSTCVRIFRGYGIGSRDVISRWVREALRGEAITVYQPEGRFDYIYSKDSAGGLVHLANAKTLPAIVNLGTGRSRSVAEVLQVLARYLPDIRRKDEAAALPYEASEADMTRYFALTGWMPKYSLESAIPEIIAFERDNLLDAQS
jgi:carbamoyl-phosphate synthase large subunit